MKRRNVVLSFVALAAASAAGAQIAARPQPFPCGGADCRPMPGPNCLYAPCDPVPLDPPPNPEMLRDMMRDMENALRRPHFQQADPGASLRALNMMFDQSKTRGSTEDGVAVAVDGDASRGAKSRIPSALVKTDGLKMRLNRNDVDVPLPGEEPHDRDRVAVHAARSRLMRVDWDNAAMQAAAGAALGAASGTVGGVVVGAIGGAVRGAITDINQGIQNNEQRYQQGTQQFNQNRRR